MGDKNGKIQEIDQTHTVSRLLPHKYLTMINVMGPDEMRLSQFICVKIEGSDRLEQNIHGSLRGKY